jgi:hypothetical protein
MALCEKRGMITPRIPHTNQIYVFLCLRARSLTNQSFFFSSPLFLSLEKIITLHFRILDSTRKQNRTAELSVIQQDVKTCISLSLFSFDQCFLSIFLFLISQSPNHTIIKSHNLIISSSQNLLISYLHFLANPLIFGYILQL